MPKVVIKPLDAIVDKWVRVTPGRMEDYRKGVETTEKDWAALTAAAEETWKAGVGAAAAKGLFSKGVKEKGTAYWKTRTLEKGPARWSDGVAKGRDDYERGFSPYHSVIAAVDLPARKPAGDPANIERVRVIAAALHRKKVGA